VTTTNHAALIAAAEARAAAAHAEVADLREKLAAEQEASRTVAGVEILNETFEERGLTGAPRQQTTEEAIAEARRRGGGKTRSEQLAAVSGIAAEIVARHKDSAATSASDGKAEAQRRIAARRSHAQN
jgi:hypothetical protein